LIQDYQKNHLAHTYKSPQNEFKNRHADRETAREFKPPTYLFNGKTIKCIGVDEKAEKGFSKISSAKILNAINSGIERKDAAVTENIDRLKDIMKPIRDTKYSILGKWISKIKNLFINKSFITSSQYAEIVDLQLDKF
jgi:hypothetical protein